MDEKQMLEIGIENYIQRIKKCKEIYMKLIEDMPKNSNEKIYRIQDRDIFNLIISSFTPALEQENAKEDLMQVYTIKQKH